MIPVALTNRNKQIYRLMGILLALALLAGYLPQPALAASNAATSTCNTKYTVKSGDTLSSIASQYKINWLDLANANDLKSPYTIYIGQVLCVPAASSTTSSGSSSSSSSSNKTSFSLELKGSSLVINTTKFPKKSMYYVKVSSGRFYQGPTIYKLRMLRVGNHPDNTYTYKLPKELNSADYVMVCLKNVITNVNTCHSVKR